MFIENESFMHKKAKEVLKEWLDNINLKKDDYVTLRPLCFRSNRASGVFLEYPVCIKDGGINSWETNWDEIIDRDHEKYWNEYVPTYDECVKEFNCYPIAIIDVVTSAKGRPKTAIEIKYKNKVSEKKIKDLKKVGVNDLIEIDAEWILRQTKIPDKLEYTRLI